MKLKDLLNSSDTHYTPYQFTIFRVVFGVYLLWHFLVLFPNATELFSSNGILPDPSLNFTFPLAPWNPLYYFDSPAIISSFIVLCITLSAILTLGWQRPTVAFLFWFCWACLYNRNNLISNPSIPYIGLLLLLLVIVPKGEPLSYKEKSKDWHMPIMIPIVAWILMAIGYSFSGIDKLFSPSWQDGSAMTHLLNNPLARDNFLRYSISILPPEVLKLMTWGVLLAEITFAPLCLCRRGRFIVWTIMVTMHIGIMTIISFSDLSLGMLMLHLFTFDQRWLRKNKEKVTILYDGECGLCSKAMRFIAEEDSADCFKMRSLQEQEGQSLLKTYGLPTNTLDTMVLIKKGKAYIKSEAVIETGKSLGGIWSLGHMLYIIPKIPLERGYEWVSRNRISFFGKHKACDIPSPRLRKKLM